MQTIHLMSKSDLVMVRYGSGPVICTLPDTGHWSSAPEADFAEVGSGWKADRTP